MKLTAAGWFWTIYLILAGIVIFVIIKELLEELDTCWVHGFQNGASADRED